MIVWNFYFQMPGPNYYPKKQIPAPTMVSTFSNSTDWWHVILYSSGAQNLLRFCSDTQIRDQNILLFCMQNWSLETEIGERISAWQERLAAKYNFLAIVEFTHRCLKSGGELILAQSTLQTLLGPRTVTHMEAWEFHFASTTAKDAKVRLSWTVNSSKESLLFTTPDWRLFANCLLPISSSRLPTSYPKIQ